MGNIKQTNTRTLLFVSLVAATLLLSTSTATAASNYAVVTDRVGEVTATRSGKTITPKIGARLRADDIIETGDAGKTRLLLADNSVITIGPRSRIKLGEMTLDRGRNFKLDVLLGRFKMHIAKWFLGPTEATLSTPSAVIGVRGTVVWGDTEIDAVCALEGTVNLRSKTGREEGVDLTDGQCASEMADGNTTPLQPTQEQLVGFLKEVTID